ncbi:hypothetical protein PIB30_046386 [Stylosanthes scabra]|uniref:Uncharacterized protein n=1 Tax=Stylosanthes scabra TaxID=79078 RepID=A0ABU6RGF6_9FABA|nr:hypothetical protein [Stylosanthes scabra]
MAPRGRSRRPARGGSEAGQADEAAPAPQAGQNSQDPEGLYRLNDEWHIAGALAGPVRAKLSLRDQRRRARMVEYGEPGPDDHGAHDQPGFGIHEQHEFQPGQDPTISPSGMIMFSPAAARAYPSPYHAGTSSQPEYGSDHLAPFMPQTQEHTGLDELLYQMSTCPPAEFSSIVSTYRLTRAQHDRQVFDSSRIGSEYATPTSYHAPSSYHSQSFYGHSAPLPSMAQSQQSSVDPPQLAEAPQAPQSRRATRAVIPPRCGTGGHMQPRGGRH